MVKKILYQLLLVSVITSLFAGFLKRDEIDEYKRENPVDSGGDAYQGWVTHDFDGDGEGDYIIIMDSIVTDPNIEITFQNGPKANFVFISTNEDLSGAVQIPFTQSINYSYLGDYGSNILYFTFEFYDGHKSKKIYSKPFEYVDPNDLNIIWNNYSFDVTLNGGDKFTTNTNISIDADHPVSATLMKIGFYSNGGVWQILNLPTNKSFAFSHVVSNVEIYLGLSTGPQCTISCRLQ